MSGAPKSDESASAPLPIIMANRNVFGEKFKKDEPRAEVRVTSYNCTTAQSHEAEATVARAIADAGAASLTSPPHAKDIFVGGPDPTPPFASVTEPHVYNEKTHEFEQVADIMDRIARDGDEGHARIQDAAFIAAARTDVLTLSDEVIALLDEIEALRARLEKDEKFYADAQSILSGSVQEKSDAR